MAGGELGQDNLLILGRLPAHLALMQAVLARLPAAEPEYEKGASHQI